MRNLQETYSDNRRKEGFRKPFNSTNRNNTPFSNGSRNNQSAGGQCNNIQSAGEVDRNNRSTTDDLLYGGNRNGATSHSVATLFNLDPTKLLDEKPDRAEKVRRELRVIQGRVAGKMVEVLVDSGSQISCVSERFVEELRNDNILTPRLPSGDASVVGAIGKKGQKVKDQVLLTFKVGPAVFDWACIVIPALNRNIILGSDWLVDHRAILNFAERKLVGSFGDEMVEVHFEQWDASSDELGVQEISVDRSCQQLGKKPVRYHESQKFGRWRIMRGCIWKANKTCYSVSC